MFVRSLKAFEFKAENGRTTRVPRNWAGELPEAVAKEAIKAGNAAAPDHKAETEVEASKEPAKTPARKAAS